MVASWEQTDSLSLKSSFVRVHFEHEQMLDRLVMSMKGAPYFHRTATLMQRVVPDDARTKPYFQTLASFTISSRQSSVVELPGLRGREFIIQIMNEDNPPLQVAAIEAKQLNRYLVAWLKADEKYTLMYGPASMISPRYDLVNFQDSIPDVLSAVKVEKSSAIMTASPEPAKTIFTSNIIIWIAIVAVVGVLGILAIKMTKEL